MRTYTDLVPAFPDQEDWTLATALRHHAGRRPDAVLLDLPEEGVTFTYAEALAQAESVADRLAEAGAAPGDRVLVMAANSSQFLRTWLGTGVGQRGSAAPSRSRSTPPTRACSSPTSCPSPPPAGP
jgi:crotonobetaine/carnitine-CoA ligase